MPIEGKIIFTAEKTGIYSTLIAVPCAEYEVHTDFHGDISETMLYVVGYLIACGMNATEKKYLLSRDEQSGNWKFTLFPDMELPKKAEYEQTLLKGYFEKKYNKDSFTNLFHEILRRENLFSVCAKSFFFGRQKVNFRIEKRTSGTGTSHDT